ncbi:MAG TPA: hypothetical protein VJ794_10615 [Gemmatimonadales bacterium]|nr:hypothetical protein [Gemmatimonadales bacterium]
MLDMVPLAALRVTFLLLLLLTPASAHAQLNEGRFFTATVEPAKVAVGDSVTVRFRLIINERDLLTDTVPRPLGELPPGVRVLAAEKLQRGPDRAFTGSAVLAFYRPGKQQVPPFGLPWVQIVTGHRGVMAHDPADIEVMSVLPGGNPSLRDIREPEAPASLAPLWTLLGALGATGLAWMVARRRRREETPVAAPVEPPSPPPPPDPYTLALARLDAIERERRAADGDVERHYESVADVVREYLETAEGIPAPERTTSELLWSLPPRLAEGGLRRRVHDVLGAADLVKFARRRPGATEAAGYTRAARELLARWHQAMAAEELDAIR